MNWFQNSHLSLYYGLIKLHVLSSLGWVPVGIKPEPLSEHCQSTGARPSESHTGLLFGNGFTAVRTPDTCHLSTHSSNESGIRDEAWKFLLGEMGWCGARLCYWSEWVINGKFIDGLSVRQKVTSQTWTAFCQVIKLVITCLPDIL